MIRLSRARIASALALLSTVCAAIGVAFVVANGRVGGDQFWAAQVLVGVVYAWVGARVIAREPRNLVGWLLLAGALSWAAGLALAQYAWFAVFGPARDLPLVAASAWLGSWIWFPGTILMLTFLPLHFPDGRLPSTRWRPVAIGMAVLAAIAVFTQAAAAWALLGDLPRLLTGDLSTSGEIADVSNFLTFLTPLVAALSVIIRWRGSSGVRRLQIRWFATAILASAILVIVAGGESLDGLLGTIVWLGAFALLPIAIGIAILRYRLYDIDRVVSRTLAYALLTGGLLVVYLGVNLVLTTLLSSAASSNSVVVAASTLVVAALFAPLRRRVQHLVDRRFDRARYDADRTTAAFSDRMRDEMDLPAVAADLDSTIRAAVAPTNVGLWLRVGGP